MTRTAPGLWTALLIGCGPYSAWPDPSTVFPEVVEAEGPLEPYETIRWETEASDPTDLTFVGLYLQKAVFHRPSASADVLAHFEQMRVTLPPLDGPPDLTAAGDIMYRMQDNWGAYAGPAAPLMDGALRIGNLETPTSPNFSTEPRAHGTYAFNAPPSMLDSLPVDALQVNNNHSLDVGDAGLTDTVEAMAARDQLAFGLGAPTVVEVDGRQVGLFAYTWGVNDGRTSALHDLNIVRFGQIDATDLSSLANDLATTDADLSVVYVHWGFEYEYYPDPHFLRLSRAIIRAGADVVIGHGPHVVQPAELCHVNTPSVVPGIGTCSVRTDDDRPRTAAVLYSLGDFGTDIPTVPTAVGIIGSLTFDQQGITGIGWEGVASVTEQGTAWVRPLNNVLTETRYADELERMVDHLGSTWQR